MKLRGESTAIQKLYISSPYARETYRLKQVSAERNFNNFEA